MLRDKRRLKMQYSEMLMTCFQKKAALIMRHVRCPFYEFFMLIIQF